MESSLGHKDTNETYYNSFGIFTTSCIKNRKAFQWSLSFAIIDFYAGSHGFSSIV